jgi:ABC-type multidrug transport system fused ATPase/permease subunit
MRLPVQFFERTRIGDLLARVNGDVDTVENLLDTFVKDIAAEAVMFAGAVAFLVHVNFGLTLWLLPTIPAMALSVVFFKRTVKRYARRLRDMIGEMAAMAGDAIAGIRVVKAFTGERFEADRFAMKSRDLLRARVQTAKLRSIYATVVDAWMVFGTIAVIVVAVPDVVAGTFTIGALVAYLGYLNKLYGPAKKLSKVNFSVQKIIAASDRIFEVMAEPLEEMERGRRPALAIASLRDMEHVDGGAAAVRFDRVSFAYDRRKPVLHELSLDVAPGEMIALVGPSGAGKSTLINLLFGFYRPTSGTILFDGVPLDDVPLARLRRMIAVVPQDTFLFAGSLRDNIAYAVPGATDEQIVSAAIAACAHDFIVALPDGYRTDVGERGIKLSGGQRQRLAIARALLRSPRVLIFDEATSHLDSESEHLVQQALERGAKGRTVFAIAHRLSTVWQADKIVVLEAGAVVQVGRHEELIRHGGLYKRLVELQLDPLARRRQA